MGWLRKKVTEEVMEKMRDFREAKAPKKEIADKLNLSYAICQVAEPLQAHREQTDLGHERGSVPEEREDRAPFKPETS